MPTSGFYWVEVLDSVEDETKETNCVFLCSNSLPKSLSIVRSIIIFHVSWSIYVFPQLWAPKIPHLLLVLSLDGTSELLRRPLVYGHKKAMLAQWSCGSSSMIRFPALKDTRFQPIIAGCVSNQNVMVAHMSFALVLLVSWELNNTMAERTKVEYLIGCCGEPIESWHVKSKKESPPHRETPV